LRPPRLVSLNRLLLRQPRQRSLTKISLTFFVEQSPRIAAGNRVSTQIIGNDRDRSGAKKIGPTLHRFS
jgi:hypothetical protein